MASGIFLLSEANEPHTRIRGTYGYGFFFFMCYYCLVFHWFANLYPLEFIDGMTPFAAIVVVIAGCVGVSLVQSLFGGIMFIVVRMCLRTRLLTNKKILRPFYLKKAPKKEENGGSVKKYLTKPKKSCIIVPIMRPIGASSK